MIGLVICLTILYQRNNSFAKISKRENINAINSKNVTVDVIESIFENTFMSFEL